MSAAALALMDWLKSATSPTEAPIVTPCYPEKQRGGNTGVTEVFIGETPPKMGLVTSVTPVTPKKGQGQTKNTETAPTEAPTAPPAPATPPAKPRAWFQLDSSWRTAARAWHGHRANCPTCITADRTAATAGTGQRCEAGQALYDAYQAAFDAAVG